MSPLRVTVTDMVAAAPATRARIRRDILSIQLAVYRAGPDVTAEDAAQRVTAYVDMVLDTERFARFNVATVAYDGDTPVACCLGATRLAEVCGETVEVARCGANVLPAYRARSLVSAMYSRLAVAYGRRFWRSRHRRLYLGHCMSPVMYHFTYRRTAQLYPGPRSVEPFLRQAYADLVGHEPRAVPEPVGSDTDPRTEAWLARTDSESVRYFLQINPHFREGYALPILAEASTGTLLRSIWTSLVSTWRKRRAKRALRGQAAARRSLEQPSN